MLSTYDSILRNGMLIDGTGRAAVKAGVAIDGDRIAQIGDLSRAKGRIDLDIEGGVVAPGFIDAHTHDDAALISRSSMLPKLTQGVTSVICGNCGVSGAPYLGFGEPSGLLRIVQVVSRGFRHPVRVSEARVGGSAGG